eukprot:TRINITY_DN165_c0_g1_i6.p1 TRINITY_DN165_c0_g1~~TRINITY_DN165_c0_g1_i6.p1  ORF type:complete len:658 (+),score=-1.44 TRINITY_DN165_c0_g1_i6:98-1975(+)
MLKVFNILLLVSMASMCRALAEWSVSTPRSSEVMALSKENHLFLFGAQPIPWKSNFGLSVIEYDSEGSLLWSSIINTKHLASVVAVEVEEDDFVLLLKKQDRNTSYGYYPELRRITKKGETVWSKTYPDEYRNEGLHSLRAKEGYLIAGTLNVNLLKVTMVNTEGDVLWIETYNNIHILEGLARSTNGYFLVTSRIGSEQSCILCINSTGVLQEVLHTINMEIGVVTECGSGSVCFIYYDNQAPYIGKINDRCIMEWNVSIDIKKRIGFDEIKQISQGNYMAAGGVNFLPGNFGILVKFYPEGRIKWKKVFTAHESFVRLIESEENVYYILSLNGQERRQYVIKYTVPGYAEGLHCAEYEQCQACGLGSYWNYTSCIPCSIGCIECADIDHCFTCSSRYEKTEDNKCKLVEEPCNCDLPDLTPECREKCALPICSSNSSVPFTYLIGRKKACTCPNGMLSNETHCLPQTKVGCSPLCDICAGQYCLHCKNMTGVFVSRTHSIGVKCQCDYGYLFNSTDCIPVKRIHNVQSAESIVAILLGIVGGLLAVGSVAFIMYWKYRRDEWMHGENLPDIQTAKEQPTVEISKEMDVRTITRDDDRTGEIVFKREQITSLLQLYSMQCQFII